MELFGLCKGNNKKRFKKIKFVDAYKQKICEHKFSKIEINVVKSRNRYLDGVEGKG